jgi:hypothetical protein
VFEVLPVCVGNGEDLAVLKYLQDGLLAFEPKREPLMAGMIVSYLSFKQCVFEHLDETGPEDPLTLNQYTPIQPNRTFALDGRELRSTLQGLRHDWRSGLVGASGGDRIFDTRSARLYLSFPNFGGLKLAHDSCEQRWLTVRYAATTVARLRMAMAVLALRRYELAHHAMPVSLGDLVPEFLSEVPLDPFDDKPLRWDPARKWLYSVGENGVDDGGNEGHPHSRCLHCNHGPLDVVMPYWWLPDSAKKGP